MLNALSAAALGFLLGLRHATDADHVVAVTTFVTRERSFRGAAWIGGLWGAGHSLTVLVVGGALVVFRLVIPPRVGLGLEFAVALMLILLGFTNLRPVDARPAADGGTLPPKRAPGWRPLVVGVVHGLAGSAAVAILVLAAIPETGWAVAYLALFGLGTIAGMMLVTWLIAVPAIHAAQRVAGFQRGIRLAAGALSLILGLVLARELVVERGLFSTTPTWTPK